MRHFESLTDFLAAVAGAADHPGAMDDRLREHFVPGRGYEAAAGNHEGVPSEGGYAVPDQYVDTFWQSTYSTGQLLSLCSKLTMRSGTLKVPAIGDTDRSDGNRFGGLQMNWIERPGDEIPASKPQVRRIEFTTRRLAGLTWSSDELIEDAPAWEATLTRLYGLESAHCIEQEIVDGEGTRGPLGVLNSGALITVQPESGQGAGTIEAGNVTAMWSRLWAASRRRAYWIANDDVDAQLAQSKLATGSALSDLVTFGDGGMLIMGRPVLPMEQCPSLGSLGDLILMDPTQYIVAERSTRAESSVHVRFLYGESAFRFSVRLDGQPAWLAPITPKRAVATQSPFVALAAR